MQQAISSHCTPSTSGTTTTFTCSWQVTENAAVVLGPMPQNASWVVNLSLPPSSCLDSIYYGTEELTGLTDIIPINPADALQVQVVSEIRNSACGVLTSCTTCMAAEGCGWCPDLGYCMEGTPSGPTIGTCSVWRYGNDPTESRAVTFNGFDTPVYPSITDIYLVEGSPLNVYVYNVFPSSLTLQVMFMVDLSFGMGPALQAFGQQASQLFTDIKTTYPNSQAAVASFIDKPIVPYGSPTAGDYVYALNSLLLDDSTQFSQFVQFLTIGNGLDEPNAQLEALMQIALHIQPLGFGDHSVCVIITRTSFHTPPTPGLTPNNLDQFTDPNEDYPTPTEVRNALVSNNLVPLFVVLEPAVLGNYTQLVQGWGFGVVVSATASTISAAVKQGLQQVFSTATLQASDTQVVTDIYPSTPYTSVQENTRVRFSLTVDKQAVKRAIVEFDEVVTLTVPGYGTATLRLATSDAPVGTNIPISTKENTEIAITLNGDNIYHTQLGYEIVSLPTAGTIVQYGTREAIAPGDFVKDPLHRVVFIPAVNGTCQYQESDYCSRKRSLDCNNPCPYAIFQYAVVDLCSSKSTNISVSVDVLPDVQNNRPVAQLTTNVVVNEDAKTPIFLAGTDSDGDTLTSVITALPAIGTTEDLNGNITAAMLPYTVPNRTIYWTPPYHRWGDNLATFTYYVNDGHPAYELGNSLPLTVPISVQLTDHAPVAYDVASQPANEAPYIQPVQVDLKVFDQDSVDYARGEISVKMVTFPTADQGYFTQTDQVTVIDASSPYVPISGTTSDGKPVWSIVLQANKYLYGNFSFSYKASDTQFDSNVATATFVINFVNQYPTSSTIQQVFINDTDITYLNFTGSDLEGDPFYFYIYAFNGGGNITDVGNGQVYGSPSSGIVVSSANELKYTPANYESAPCTYDQNAVMTYIVCDRPVSECLTDAYNLVVFVFHVNSAPVISSPITSYTQTGLANTVTTLVLDNIVIKDVDGCGLPEFTTFSLNGPGSISLTAPASCPIAVQNTTYIALNCSVDVLTQALVSGLSYDITPTSDTQSYVSTLTITVNDLGHSSSDYDPILITSYILTIHTSLGVAGNSVAVTAGAVGAGAAAAVGVAVTYKFLKMKKVFNDENDPFAGMGNDVDTADVVLENPLYMQPSASH